MLGLEKQPEKILLFCAVVYSVLFFLFFPAFYSSIDERAYVNNSVLLAQGTLFGQGPGESCNSSFTEQGYHSSYFIGKSAFLLPFLAGGIGGVMASGLVIHLLNFFMFYLILKKMKQNVMCSLLYLLFPAFVWGSRTLYPELLVLTFFLAGFLALLYEKRNFLLLSGALFGIACFVRYDAVLGFAAFFISFLVKDRKKALFFLLGFLPFAFAILCFNQFVYGGPLQSGYGDVLSLASRSVEFGFFAALAGFVVILTLFYPLLLESAFLAKYKHRLAIALVAVFYILFYSRYAVANFLNYDFNAFLFLTIRLRYLFPAIGMLLVPFSVMLTAQLRKWKRYELPLWTGFIVVFIAGAAALSMVHAGFVGERFSVWEQVYANTPEGSMVIGSSDDCMYFSSGFFPEREYFSVDLDNSIRNLPEGTALEDFVQGEAFVMDLRYANRAGSSGPRQDTIDEERKKLADFIEAHSGGLELVFETTEPHSLKVYRLVLGE